MTRSHTINPPPPPPQIVENEKKERTLVEIGPRFVLHLHRIFDGSFGGPTLYLNPNFISPNRVRIFLFLWSRGLVLTIIV
jgi:hypothetical protein